MRREVGAEFAWDLPPPLQQVLILLYLAQLMFGQRSDVQVKKRVVAGVFGKAATETEVVLVRYFAIRNTVFFLGLCYPSEQARSGLSGLLFFDQCRELVSQAVSLAAGLHQPAQV
jgi:hypothetical protein